MMTFFIGFFVSFLFNSCFAGCCCKGNNQQRTNGNIQNGHDNIIQGRNENENESILESSPGYENINKPALIGLNNVGATCFMNSTLQCLSQTKELSRYFLNEGKNQKIINNNVANKNKNDLQLSLVFCNLIRKLWKNCDGERFSPNEFWNQVKLMNPLFKDYEAGDSKDFIIFVLEQLHKELSKSVKEINYYNTNNKMQNIVNPNQYDKNNAFNFFFNNFKQQCSIISDVFFGFTETTNVCQYCKNYYNSQGLNNPICYNYQVFNCLIFPLEEVKNMKNNSFQFNNIQMNQNNRVNLYDCFVYNQKPEIFTGPNQNYCNNCKQLCDSVYTSKIYSAPNVLVLILNRGKGNIYDVKLDFTETIDITQFVDQKDKPKMEYELYGVITHIGQSGLMLILWLLVRALSIVNGIVLMIHLLLLLIIFKKK